MKTILRLLVDFVEKQCVGVRASVLLLGQPKKQLRHCVASSLPDAYNQAVDGLGVGPYACC